MGHVCIEFLPSSHHQPPPVDNYLRRRLQNGLVDHVRNPLHCPQLLLTPDLHSHPVDVDEIVEDALEKMDVLKVELFVEREEVEVFLKEG